jgi:hypothetical protein
VATVRARAARRGSEVGRAVGAAIVAGLIYDIVKMGFMWFWRESQERKAS